MKRILLSGVVAASYIKLTSAGRSKFPLMVFNRVGDKIELCILRPVFKKISIL